MERLLIGKVAAVSVGIVEGARTSTSTTPRTRGPRSTSTSVGTDAGTYVEWQGTAEGKPFDRAGASDLLDLADRGLARLFEAQSSTLATVRR
jgi:ribonuclease PH